MRFIRWLYLHIELRRLYYFKWLPARRSMRKNINALTAALYEAEKAFDKVL